MRLSGSSQLLSGAHCDKHFRKTLDALDGALGLGMVPQELRLDYPFDLFEDLRGNEIANSFSPGPKDCFKRSGLGKMEGRNKDIVSITTLSMDCSPRDSSTSRWMSSSVLIPVSADFIRA